VLFSAHPQGARVAPTDRRLAGAGAEPSPFVMLLRKHLEGQRVLAVEQSGRDRVLRLRAGAEGVTLVAEVMGKHSNVILVDGAGVIMGSIKRVSAAINRYREVLPHRPYVPPPPPLRRNPAGGELPKLDPLTCLAGELAAALHSQPPEQPLWQGLVECLDGCSPQLAREVVARLRQSGLLARSCADAVTLESSSALLAIVRALYKPAGGSPEWTPQPTIAWKGETIAGWAVYPLQQYDGQEGIEVRPCASLEEMLDRVYGAGEAGSDMAAPLDAARKPLLTGLDAHRERARRKIASLRAGLLDPAAIAALRDKGQLLLAYGHTLEPDQTLLRLEDPPLEIAVDPALTAVENAQAYFHRYAKARDAARKVPALIEDTQAELSFLEQARVFVEVARSPGDLAQIRADLRDAGVAADLAAAPRKAPKQPQWSRRKASKGAAAGKGTAAAQAVMRVRGSDGMEILVGRSAAQNDLVTFSLAAGDDIWLHAREIPGAHVIIKSGGRPPAPGTLRQAAELAATFSQGRGATAVPVDYTQVRHVRRIKGSKPGLVHYSGETTLNVRPRAEDDVT
jgi:predicted ribosome quality control (RQC) complex YloA/Tae2 family protein